LIAAFWRSTTWLHRSWRSERSSWKLTLFTDRFLAGAASIAAGVLRGGELGAMTGTLAGPLGTTVGTITGAIIGGLIGGATGGALGAKLGEVVDQNVFDNFQCLACHYTFSKKSPEPEPMYPTGM
jgi:hypothetical protein